jgi:predicted SAM-dependent methyltransferase
MRANGYVYRHLRAPRRGSLKVHLGPGQRNYLQGWVNVDANMFTARCDVWADLRNALPFRPDTVEAFYSHHVVEHLPDLSAHFRDVFRCLKPGGVYRVAGPNGDAAIRRFLAEDKQWFGDFPDKRHSIGGRLENFIFCRREHLTILTQSFLEELLVEAGFRDFGACLPSTQTGFDALFRDCLGTESETDFTDPHTLVIEAVKPDRAH